MSETIQAFLIVEIFRLLCVFAGVLLAYWGYRLFKVGLYEKQGELKASYGKVSLVLRQVGPGIFFALFGVALAYIGCIRKFEIESGEGSAIKQLSQELDKPHYDPNGPNSPKRLENSVPPLQK